MRSEQRCWNKPNMQTRRYNESEVEARTTFTDVFIHKAYA